MGPIKPEPDGILRACERLAVAPARTACVGDFHYDILAANAAGAFSVLFVPSGARPEFADEADRVIARLDELPGVLGL
jgi:phosphoglycolate phosphatase-like HAD superfamily hydrolase